MKAANHKYHSSTSPESRLRSFTGPSHSPTNPVCENLDNASFLSPSASISLGGTPRGLRGFTSQLRYTEISSVGSGECALRVYRRHFGSGVQFLESRVAVPGPLPSRRTQACRPPRHFLCSRKQTFLPPPLPSTSSICNRITTNYRCDRAGPANPTHWYWRTTRKTTPPRAQSRRKNQAPRHRLPHLPPLAAMAHSQPASSHAATPPQPGVKAMLPSTTDSPRSVKCASSPLITSSMLTYPPQDPHPKHTLVRLPSMGYCVLCRHLKQKALHKPESREAKIWRDRQKLYPAPKGGARTSFGCGGCEVRGRLIPLCKVNCFRLWHEL
jgi:hypothetical protein